MVKVQDEVVNKLELVETAPEGRSRKNLLELERYYAASRQKREEVLVRAGTGREERTEEYRFEGAARAPQAPSLSAETSMAPLNPCC